MQTIITIIVSTAVFSGIITPLALCIISYYEHKRMLLLEYCVNNLQDTMIESIKEMSALKVQIEAVENHANALDRIIREMFKYRKMEAAEAAKDELKAFFSESGEGRDLVDELLRERKATPSQD